MVHETTGHDERSLLIRSVAQTTETKSEKKERKKEEREKRERKRQIEIKKKETVANDIRTKDREKIDIRSFLALKIHRAGWDCIVVMLDITTLHHIPHFDLY